MKLKVSGFGQIDFADVCKFYHVASVGLELHINIMLVQLAQSLIAP
jgi:hypothetical protein